MLMMQDRPRGLFAGGSRMNGRLAGIVPTLRNGEPTLPGPISGFGGGTWNMDGSMATPVDREEPMARPDGTLGASAFGWDEAGTDTLPKLPPPTPSLPMVRPSGIFGSSSPSRAPAPTGAAAMGKLTNDFPPVSGTGERLGSNGFPVRPMGFDYDAAMASLLPQKKKRSTLDKIATVALPALMSLAGNQAGANAFIQAQWARRNDLQRREVEAAETIAKWKHDDWARQNGADLRASAPRVIGRSMVQYDPTAGSVNELYDGPEDWDEWAADRGLEPGTPEYFEAVEDYVLKSDGPSAYERDIGLDDHRTGNRLRIEGVRQGNRVGLEGIRQSNRVTVKGAPTYRDLNPRAGRGSARPTATSPDGRKVEWNGSAWVPVGGN